MDREAVGQPAAGGDDTAGHQAEGAIGTDPQHRDLVAARINGDQEPAVRRELQRALRGQPGAGPGPAGRERRPGLGGQRAISVAVKRPDRVGRFGVVVDVDVPDHRGRTVRRRSGGGRGNRARPRPRPGRAPAHRTCRGSGNTLPAVLRCWPGRPSARGDVIQTSSAALSFRRAGTGSAAHGRHDVCSPCIRGRRRQGFPQSGTKTNGRTTGRRSGCRRRYGSRTRSGGRPGRPPARGSG